MTNKFISKGAPVQSKRGPLASAEHVSPDEGIGAWCIKEREHIMIGRRIKAKYIVCH
jgi:hypothetical protein